MDASVSSSCWGSQPPTLPIRPQQHELDYSLLNQYAFGNRQLADYGNTIPQSTTFGGPTWYHEHDPCSTDIADPVAISSQHRIAEDRGTTLALEDPWSSNAHVIQITGQNFDERTRNHEMQPVLTGHAMAIGPSPWPYAYDGGLNGEFVPTTELSAGPALILPSHT